MAERMYVNNGSPVAEDFAVGAHVGDCQNTACTRLNDAYWNILRPNGLSGTDLAVWLRGFKMGVENIPR